MDKEDALKWVENIRKMAGDDEVAHGSEDLLRATFIEYVASREDELGEIARIVLETDNIEFARWCA